jgi:hypothetical protein
MTRDQLNTGGFEYPREILNDNTEFWKNLLNNESIRISIAPFLSKSDVQQQLEVINFCKEKGEYLTEGRIVNNRAVKISVDVLEFANAHKTEKALTFGDPKRTLESHNLHEVVKITCQARKDSLGRVIEEKSSYSLGNGRVITGVVVLTQGVDDNNLEIGLNSDYLRLTYNFSNYPIDGSFNYSARLIPGTATSSRAIGFKIERLVTMFDAEIEKTTQYLVPQFIKVPRTNHFKANGFKTSIKKHFLLEG